MTIFKKKISSVDSILSVFNTAIDRLTKSIEDNLSQKGKDSLEISPLRYNIEECESEIKRATKVRAKLEAMIKED